MEIHPNDKKISELVLPFTEGDSWKADTVTAEEGRMLSLACSDFFNNTFMFSVLLDAFLETYLDKLVGVGELDKLRESAVYLKDQMTVSGSSVGLPWTPVRVLVRVIQRDYYQVSFFSSLLHSEVLLPLEEKGDKRKMVFKMNNKEMWELKR